MHTSLQRRPFAPAPSQAALSRHAGVTLVELLIALVLAALIVLASTAMVITSRTSYRTQDENTRLAESARFALDLSNRMVRLGGYTNFGDDPSIPAFYSPDPAWLVTMDVYAPNGPDLVGASNSKPGGGTGYNNSDSLVVRYFGANSPGDKDFGAIVDCAGFPVPQPTGAPASSLALVNRTNRAFSILYVDSDPDGEPALKCKRQTYDIHVPPGAITGTEIQTLIRGVEEFRVLYGEALYLPTQDPDLVLAPAIAYRGGVGSANPVSHWNNVVSVKIAMLLRSAPGARADLDTTDYDLFGTGYVATDSTTRFSTAALTPASERTRARRIVETTVFIRNRLSSWPSLNVD